jgi:hypothetical protein
MKSLRAMAIIAAIGALLTIVNLSMTSHSETGHYYGPAFATDPTVPIPPPPPPPPFSIA